MHDTALYEYLLGLQAPWTVSRVDLDVKRRQVDVWAEHAPGIEWPCPECAGQGRL